MLAGVFVVLVLLVFTAWQAIQVRIALNDVSIRMTKMVDELAQGDVDEAETNADLAGDSASKALAYTRGPVWWTASKLPWIGDDVTAVRTVSEVVEDLTDDTIPDLVEAGGAFGPSSLNPKGGRIDLDPIPAVAPVLAEGADDIEAARVRVEDIPTAGLVEELRGPVADLQDKLTSAATAASSAATAAELMPEMLGAEGKRTYLVVFQNNAEIRAQGGLMGALAIVTAEDGKLEMVKQGRPADIGTFAPDFIDLTKEERTIHSTRLSIYPQDATFIPDFARSSEILTQMWEAREPEQLDGVISIDPVALGYLLRGTGPVKLNDGQSIDSTNAASVLMRDSYAEFPDPAAQNDFFDDVARRTFNSLLGGAEDPKGMLSGLAQGASERRLMLWSRHPDEQAEIAGSTISGELDAEAGTKPDVGVFLNDSAADKLSYYLDYEVDVSPRSCGSEGSQVIDVHVKMRSTVPEGAALPSYVLGPPNPITDPGEMLNTLYVYSPVGGRVDQVTSGGKGLPTAFDSYRGREVGSVTVLLKPGESKVVDYVVISGPDQTGDPQLTTTPAALSTGQGFIGRSAC